jgi:competence protein ComEC
MIKQMLRTIGFALILLAGIEPALADHVVVKRHVTLRAGPTRASEVVIFPDIGAPLSLLDSGARTRGYYHVALADGRTGWIYYTFVERREGEAPGVALAPLTGTGKMAVHYIDVDQGAAALLEFPCGAILIDAGGRGDAASDHLVSYLQAFFARRADLGGRIAAIFVTHTHVDHNSNLRRIAETFAVGGYVHNGILTGSGRHAAKWMAEHAPAATPPIPTIALTNAVIEASGGREVTNNVIDPVNCPTVDPKIRVISGSYAENPGWPDGEFDNGNNQSLVIRVDYGEASFLFTGDMEETALETLVDRFAGTGMLDVDVYEVGHHGSHNGTTDALLAAMTPEMAVISMGRSSVHAPWTAWAYGHPRRDAVMLVESGVSGRRTSPARVQIADKVKRFSDYTMSRAVYATGWDGDVTINANSSGITSVVLGQ